MIKKKKMEKLGIVLAGGGARGIAHIGVLQALEERKISPQYISGASAGSIVGAAYAAGKSPVEILSYFKESSSLFNIVTFGLPVKGFANLNYLKDVLAKNLGENSFDILKKKLYVSVTNLDEGKWEVIDSGPLFDVVMASSAIPLVFKPVKINGITYVDGGLLNNLPVEPLHAHCNAIIGVNVNPHGWTKDLDNMYEIGQRCFDLILWNNIENRLNQCDVIIEPEEVYNYAAFDFSKAEEIFEVGYKATKKQMPQILDKLYKLMYLNGER